MNNTSKCYHCGKMAKVKIRDVSIANWEVLFLLGEIERSEINMPVCDTCYSELRDVMIERQDEIEQLKVPQKMKKAS